MCSLHSHASKPAIMAQALEANGVEPSISSLPGGNLRRRLRLARDHLQLCSSVSDVLCMLRLPECWSAQWVCQSSPTGVACRCTADPGQLASG